MACEGKFCNGCVQQQVGVKRILPDGSGANGILIVGESPWKDEQRKGVPFAGASGYFLDDIFHRLGTFRSNFLITNVMQCSPQYLGWVGKHPDSYLAMNQCRGYLDELIERHKPRVIVTLGAIAMRRILDVEGSLENHQAYVHDSIYGIPVIPTYHPSFVIQGNRRMTAAVIYAFERALKISKEGAFYRTPVSYITHPSFDQAEEYLNNSKELLAGDIETPRSAHIDEEELEEKDESFVIVRASFSHTVGTAITMPWQEPFISLIAEAVRKVETMLFWNEGFDVPRMEANGVWFPGDIHDAMWAWHFLRSDLPKGLGFVSPFFSDLAAWKHLSATEEEFYSCCDADALLRNYLGIKEALINRGVWGRWLRHCPRIKQILKPAEKKGLLIYKEAQGVFKGVLEQNYAKAQELLQPLIPPEIQLEKKWVREPKDLTGVEVRTKVCECQKKELHGLV